MVKIESVLLGYGSGALLTPLIVIIVTFIAAATFLWNALLRQSTHYKHLPKSVQGWPVIGCWQFWSRRADFHLENSSQSPSGNFHYRVGPYSVVAVSGKDSRKVFFEHSSLDLNGGYDVLFAGAPPGPATGTKQAIPEDNFAQVLGKRLKALITTPRLQRNLPRYISDVRNKMAELKQRQSGTFDPFEDIYATVFQLTMHTVGCNEAASDRAVSDKLLYFFDKVEAAGTPTVIMFPWFPSLAKLQRVIYGGRIYMMFDEFVKTRVAEGRREDDALQHYMDNGDDTLKIIKLVIGALYAGQVNSGLNAAWVLMFLAANAEWRDACRREVETIATKHDADTSRPLSERLVAVPLTAWESDFPIGEACLRETIRMNSCGTAFRQNLSDQPVQIADGEVIPSGWFATCAMADVHYNPEFYPDPTRWDPSRFLTSATSPHAGNDVPFIGWGTGRHPCSGQRFAKLEQNLIVAFFVAEFGDFELTDMAKGLPQANINAASVQKPSKKSQWITYMSERKV